MGLNREALMVVQVSYQSTDLRYGIQATSILAPCDQQRAASPYLFYHCSGLSLGTNKCSHLLLVLLFIRLLNFVF